MGATKKAISEKHKRFADQYLIDLNAPRAYNDVFGGKWTTARTNGYKLLANARVAVYIQKRMEERNKRTEYDQDYVVNGLMEVAERCMQKVPVMEFNPVDKCMDQAQDAHGNNIWEFSGRDANKSFELLGKHKGMFTDKLDINSHLTTDVTIKIGKDELDT